jgi:hypothetical protein
MIFFIEFRFENWSPGEPSHWNEECVEIYSIEINSGKWNHLQCDWFRFALCQQFLNNSRHEIQFEKCESSQYIRYRDSCCRILIRNPLWVGLKREINVWVIIKMGVCYGLRTVLSTRSFNTGLKSLWNLLSFGLDSSQRMIH